MCFINPTIENLDGCKFWPSANFEDGSTRWVIKTWPFHSCECRLLRHCNRKDIYLIQPWLGPYGPQLGPHSGPYLWVQNLCRNHYKGTPWWGPYLCNPGRLRWISSPTGIYPQILLWWEGVSPSDWAHDENVVKSTSAAMPCQHPIIFSIICAIDGGTHSHQGEIWGYTRNRMVFILNRMEYLYVAPTMEFHSFHVIAGRGDQDSYLHLHG